MTGASGAGDGRTRNASAGGASTEAAGQAHATQSPKTRVPFICLQQAVTAACGGRNIGLVHFNPDEGPVSSGGVRKKAQGEFDGAPAPLVARQPRSKLL